MFLKDYNSYDLGQSRADVMKVYIMYYFGGECSNMLIINYLSKISVDDKAYNWLQIPFNTEDLFICLIFWY